MLITVNGGSPLLLRNDTNIQGKFIKLRLKGKKPNLMAIGAKVVVWTNGMQQQRIVRSGSSFLTQSDLSELIFGLGENPQADSIKVFWPTSGKEQILTNIATGGMLNIVEE